MSDATAPKNRPTLYDIQLPVTVVVGHTELSLQDIADWSPDTIVALKAQTDEPLELCVNGTVIATGELCEGEDGANSIAVRILDIKQDIAAQ